jgi:hypothetical protein
MKTKLLKVLVDSGTSESILKQSAAKGIPLRQGKEKKQRVGQQPQACSIQLLKLRNYNSVYLNYMPTEQFGNHFI